MQEAFSGLVDEAMDAPADYLDLRTLQSCKKQLALAGSLSREENYQIPVEINGELTAINLKILHGSEAGRVNVAVHTEEFGQITARFALREQTVSGYIACDSREGTTWLHSRQENIKSALEVPGENGQSKKADNVVILYSGEVSDGRYTQDDIKGDAGQQTADLYQMAKAFITALTA